MIIEDRANHYGEHKDVKETTSEVAVRLERKTKELRAATARAAIREEE